MSRPEHPLPEAALLAEAAWLKRLARRMVGEEDADDVVQDAYAAALEGGPKDRSRLRGWLASVVRNAARRRYRDRMRRLRREAAAAHGEAGPAGDDVVVRAEAQQRVVSAVLGLDEPYRRTVLLRFFDDLPPRKIAVRMGVPVATVHTRLRRGLDLLRSKLDERGRSWAFVLLPLLVREGRLGALLTAGGAVMSKKAALIGAAAILALSLGSVIWLSRTPGTERSRELAVTAPREGGGEEAPETGGEARATEGRVRLRGRVVDTDGIGIPGARVDLVSAASDRMGFGTVVSRTGPGILDAARAADQVRRDWERMHSAPVSRAGTACDAEAHFDLATDPLPGDHLLVRARGFAAVTETGLSLLRSAAGIEIRLNKQVARRIRVVDEQNAPVAGARVSLLAGWDLLAHAETDVDGRVDFDAEPRGITVLVEHGGYPPAFRLIRDDPQEEVKVELRATRVVEGTVLRASDRAPVAGAAVYVDVGAPLLTKTDAAGRFTLRCGDLRWMPRPVLFVDAGPAGVAAIPVTDLPPNPLEILLHPTLMLEGKLVGAVPLEGLHVFALQPGLPWRGACADSAGVFRIEGAAADVPARVLFDPWDRAYEEKGPLPRETTYEPWPGYATIEIVTKAAIEGRVVDERGEPVAGARIEMRPPYRFVEGIGTLPMCAGDEYTDDEGRFRVDGVTTRPLPSRPDVIYAPTTLRASAAGFVWGDEGPLTLEPGEERTGLVLRLERGLSITGRVVTEDGSPVPRVKVRVSERDVQSDDNRHSGWANVDAEGRYRIDALPAGTYAITVGAEEFQPVWLDRVAAGSEAPPLVLRWGATIEGVVVDEAGNPLHGVDVNAWRAETRFAARGRSDADGRFRIRQLDPGAYDVQVGEPGYLWEKKSGIAAPSSDVRFVLHRGLAIKGRIVRADGTALRSVDVQAERIPGNPNLPGSYGQAFTDDDGRFDIRGLSEGEFRLTFEKRVIREDDDNTLPPLAGVVSGSEILVRAEAGKFIEGKVVDRDGKPVKTRIEAVPLDPDGYAAGTAASGDDGRYRLGPLKGARFSLVAGWGSEYGFALDVEAGATDTNIVMGRGEVLAGKVVDKDGNPTAANVAFIHGSLGHTWQSFTEDGRFRIEGLPPGTYFLNATERNSYIAYETWRDKNRRGPPGAKVESGTLDAVLTVK